MTLQEQGEACAAIKLEAAKHFNFCTSAVNHPTSNKTIPPSLGTSPLGKRLRKDISASSDEVLAQ